MARRTPVLLLALLALLPVTAARAATTPAIKTVPVKIAATQPDDEGRPVALDGGVTFPATGCPCPGVIINHGFLGNWHDSEGITDELAAHGYVVLRYSSRGFGATPGEVDLMGPKETQDLLDAVHWLNDPHNKVVGGMVVHNRIGQFGGSYGGAHAWALARSGDPAVRTVVPAATWTNLFDALLPNGAMLLAYANGFYATGFQPAAAALNGQLSTTDNYSQNIHRWMAEANSGVGLSDIRNGLAARSVAGQYSKVRIPVFIVQGLNDGLFSANQAIDAYRALRERHRPVRLYLGGIGHPPSESSLDSPEAQHVGLEVLAWFDHYLKGIDNGIDEQPPIEYSQADYFHNHWNGTTRTAWHYPFGPKIPLSLCTTSATGGTLSATPCPSALPAVAVNSYAGTGYDQEPVTAGYMDGYNHPDLSTAPPTLTYDGPALSAPLVLAGIPKLHLRVGATDVVPVDANGAAAAFQLDPKLYDVDPSGKAKLLTRGAFTEPFDAAGPGTDTIPVHAVSFDAFGLSNTIPAGHHLRVTLQTADPPYLRPTTNPFAVVLAAGTTIDLPGVR
jgi:ABC-2 type transport system ATP-binding protein